MKHLTFALIITMCCFACGNDFTKVIDKNEFEQSIYFVDKEDLKQGTFVKISNEGDTLETAEYKDNQLDGYRYLYQQGQLDTKEMYKNGLLQGEVVSYFPNGNVRSKTNFDNNVMNDFYYTYYEDGTLKGKAKMLDNMENGPFNEYHPNGKLHWQGNFINGPNETGLLLEFSEQGDTIKKMMCGKYHGENICQTIWSKENGKVEPKLILDEE